jgi:hypothetical protein
VGLPPPHHDALAARLEPAAHMLQGIAEQVAQPAVMGGQDVAAMWQRFGCRE